MCTILGSCMQVDPDTGRTKVYAITEDGRREEGDLLIGADGIRSKVRPPHLV